MLISDKVDFRANKITRDGERNYIMIKKSIYHEDVAILNIHVLTRITKSMK